MAKASRKPKAAAPPHVSLGTVTRENLPFPVVYYPNHYGTFFAFSESEDTPPALCSCSQNAIQNLLRLKQQFPEHPNVNPLRMSLLGSYYFPNVISELSSQYHHNSLNYIRFVKGLCHRCNLVSPSLRYCHEMYGTRFIQYYGWYVNQAYLRLGILPMSFNYLVDVCPRDIQKQIDRAKAAQERFRIEEEKFLKVTFINENKSISDDEAAHNSEKRQQDAELRVSLRRESDRLLRAFTKEIENTVRKEFGFRKVGEGWVSETLLYNIISRILNNYEITRHHRPEWLNGLELDIYIPDIRLALEYQGQQHFYPIKAWGGQTALEKLIERDALKVEFCKQQSITLITIDYTEPLTEEYLRYILKKHSILTE